MCMVAQSFVLVYIWHATVLLIFVATAACKFVLQISAPVDHNFVLHLWLATVCCKALPLCSSALQLVLRRAFYLQHGQLIEMNWQLVTMKLFIHLPLCPSLLIWLSLGIFFRDFVNFLSRKVWGTRQAYTPSSAFRAPLRTTTGPGPAYGSTTGLRVYGPGLRARALGLRYGLYGPTGLRALWAHGPGLRAYGPGPGASQGSMAV